MKIYAYILHILYIMIIDYHLLFINVLENTCHVKFNY